MPVHKTFPLHKMLVTILIILPHRTVPKIMKKGTGVLEKKGTGILEKKGTGMPVHYVT
jgi:hypothetical protein